MRIGTVALEGRVLAAPMAGITDRPYRQLVRRFGAALAASEMLTSDTRLWHTSKSQRRLDFSGEAGPRCVQIAGADPVQMAAAAARCVSLGADMIDINMGCPVKKVCSAMAGSALLQDEALVAQILEAVVAAVEVPVTLKFRTGPEPANRNGPIIARMAEDLGIAALAVHGRTRADRFRGSAEYDTIARICQDMTIPVFANGDIHSWQKAIQVMEYTGASGVMIGRAAQGNPWIFRQVNHALDHRPQPAAPTAAEVSEVVTGHLHALHRFYGEYMGVRIARKHIGWYLQDRPNGKALRRLLMAEESASRQLQLLQSYFENPDIPLKAA
ncbi:MAG: tRNA dihydrouridine synthase DusB [Xanthomonadales bacterium]|nr:tRNA dihydrouridine synthase DusB [Xanthomonadales bacterium]